MAENSTCMEFSVHMKSGPNGRKELVLGERPVEPILPEGNIPRISKLMALAHRMNRLLENGEVTGYSEIAKIGRVSRARITQIMNLLNLAPDIQEEILLLPNTISGHDRINLHHVQPISREVQWVAQRKLWQQMKLQRLS